MDDDLVGAGNVTDTVCDALPAIAGPCYRCRDGEPEARMVLDAPRPPSSVAVVARGAPKRETSACLSDRGDRGAAGVRRLPALVSLSHVLRYRVYRREQAPAAHPMLEGAGGTLHARPGIRGRSLPDLSATSQLRVCRPSRA